MIRRFAALAVALACPWTAGAQRAAQVFVEGRPVPPWVLPALSDGRPMSPADFRGQKVALHVFASW